MGGPRGAYVVGYEFAGTVAGSGEPIWGVLPVQGTREGALAERIVVAADRVGPRPPRLDPVTAAACPWPAAPRSRCWSGWGCPRDRGCSCTARPVGWAPARAAGRAARPPGGAATRPDDRAQLEALGVELWLDRADPDPAAAATTALGHELDAVVDLVGGLLEPSLPHVRVGGHAATIVDLSGDLELAIDRNIDLHGVLLRVGPTASMRSQRQVAPACGPPSSRRTRSTEQPTPTAAWSPAASAASSSSPSTSGTSYALVAGTTTAHDVPKRAPGRWSGRTSAGARPRRRALPAMSTSHRPGVEPVLAVTFSSALDDRESDGRAERPAVCAART